MKKWKSWQHKKKSYIDNPVYFLWGAHSDGVSYTRGGVGGQDKRLCGR